MERRELAKVARKEPYFEASPVVEEPGFEYGTREMGTLFPFLISGGRNTERYYFAHINDNTDYKFNIRPRYFGEESAYTEVFPKRIKEILRTNADARIFCVFDWDTVYGNEIKLKKHAAFEKRIKEEISVGIVTLCPSMPCIEYWFLLHFVDDTNLYKDYDAIANRLAPYLKPCFPDSKQPLKKLLKMEKHLRESAWVENLSADGRLDRAIERAEKNIQVAVDSDTLAVQSYSFVFKVFKR